MPLKSVKQSVQQLPRCGSQVVFTFALSLIIPAALCFSAPLRAIRAAELFADTPFECEVR